MRRLLLVLVCIFSFLILSSCDYVKVDIVSFGGKTFASGTEYKYDSICITEYENSKLSMRLELKKEEDYKVEAIKVVCDEGTLSYGEEKITSKGHVIPCETYDNEVEFSINHNFSSGKLIIKDIKYDGNWQGKKLSNNEFDIVTITKDDLKLDACDSSIKIYYNTSNVKSINYEIVSTDKITANINTASNNITFISNFQLEQCELLVATFANAVINVTMEFEDFIYTGKLKYETSVLKRIEYIGLDEEYKSIYKDIYSYGYSYYWNGHSFYQNHVE